MAIIDRYNIDIEEIELPDGSVLRKAILREGKVFKNIITDTYIFNNFFLGKEEDPNSYIYVDEKDVPPEPEPEPEAEPKPSEGSETQSNESEEQ